MGTAGHRKFDTVEVTQSVESFDGQGQHGEEPAYHQTVGIMRTNMLEVVTALGFVEALVLDLPAARRPWDAPAKIFRGSISPF